MIYYIINTIVLVILTQLFCSTFLKRAEYSKAINIAFFVLWITAIQVMAELLSEVFIIKLVVGLSIHIIFALVLYKKNKVLKIIAVVTLFYVLALACELCVFALDKYLDPELLFEYVENSSISVVYMGSVSQFIQLVLVFIIRKLFHKVKSAEIESKLWPIYTVFPIYSLSLIVLLLYSFDGPTSLFQKNVFTYFAVSLLVINLFIYWFIKQESQRALNAQKTEMEIAYAKGIVQLYDQITKERDILGKREHEFKNTITALQGLIADKQYDKVNEILEVQNTELINNTNVFETGNKLINTILNTKYAETREKGIAFRFVINDLSSLKIEDRDCIVILSNILNNAIEAAKKCSDNRVLTVKAVIEDGQFIFSCRNSFINDHESDIKSTKKDVIPHGYGIDNVKEAVARNNGNCIFEKRENEFVAIVIIPL